MAIAIAAEEITLEITFPQVVLSHSPAAARDSGLDTEFNYDSIEPDDLTITLLGVWGSIAATKDSNVITLTITLSHDLTFVSDLWEGESVDVGITLLGVCTLTPSKINWVRWSNIGSLDFTIGRDNVAGERPMDWKGWVYAIKKLGKHVFVYGQYGVSIMAPSGVAWGLDTISRIGVKGKCTICGNERVHFYIDVNDRLCRVDNGIEVLGYDEFLGQMSMSTTMTLDELNQLIYICDGTYGFIYSIADKSMGEGPTNVTGLYTRNGIVYPASFGSSITTPVFSICTDIYDLGNRRNKTIQSLDIGTDLTSGLYAAIDYRNDKKVAFATTPWTTVNPSGLAVLPCFGVEFRFRVKTLVYESFSLDYIRVNGSQHAYSFIDSFMRS